MSSENLPNGGEEVYNFSDYHLGGVESDGNTTVHRRRFIQSQLRNHQVRSKIISKIECVG